MKYQHTYERLLVNEFGASFRFYRDVMGFTPTYGDENDGAYAEFDTGSPALAIFRRDLMPGIEASSGPNDCHTLIFQVEDVDAAARDLATKGVVFLHQPEDRPEWGIRTAHFRDPDGNLLEINAPIAK